ncbi:MAG: DUF2062 domain-containing protein [Nevskiales bacterium]|nr:DUF2062 domain-containing protein [Nevskiales bacterium]
MTSSTSAPPVAGFWRRRLVAPIVAQLRQGVAPAQIALALALGAALSVFPILGITTLLCALTALALRLNQPIIQLVNYLLLPVHVLLLIPFYRAGEWLFGAAPVPIVDIVELVGRFRAGPWQFILDYGRVGLYGIAVWALLAPPLTLAVYLACRPLLAAAAAGIRRRR